MNHYFVVSFGSSSGLTFLYVKNESDNFTHIYIRNQSKGVTKWV